MAITKQHNLKEQKADLPVGFKLTELGPLPEEWEVVSFDGSVLNRIVKVGKVKRQQYQPLGRFPIVDQGQSLVAGYWDGSEDVYRGTLPIVVFGDHTRIFKLIDFPFVCGADGTKVLLPNTSKYNPLFLFFAYLNLRIPSRGYNRHFRLLREQKLPLPPLPEQRAIAQVLRTVQRAKEATERVIAASRELKKSLMRHLFTYGSVPLEQADQVPLKETEIGLVPEHWKITPAGRLGQIVTGTTPRTSIKQFYNGPYPFIAPGDMGESRHVWRTAKTLSRKGLKVSRVIPKGSVVVVCIGATIGKVALTTAEESTTNQQINTIIPNNDLALAEYLHDALFYRAPDLPSLAGRAAVPIVNKSVFASFLIPLPSLLEQREIARILQAVDHKIEAEENRKAALGALFKSLLHHLMTAKIRVPVEYLKHFNSNIGGSGVRGLGADAAEEVGS